MRSQILMPQQSRICPSGKYGTISGASHTRRSCFGLLLIVASVSPRRDVSHAQIVTHGSRRVTVYTKRLWKRVCQSCLLSPDKSLTFSPTPEGYNTELQYFGQSYEDNTLLDSAILIAPLVFFIAPSDPRFTNTLDRILLPPEQGGLTSTGLVYRYDTSLSEDGEANPLPPKVLDKIQG